MDMDTRPLPVGWEERFDETYWLWTRSNPPKKSYRHPLGEITVSGRGASTVNEPGSLTPLSSNSTVNSDDVPQPIDHPEITHDAPAYSEFSERIEDTEQYEYIGNHGYREGLSSPSDFTSSSRSSELSAPSPSADDFHATSVREQSFIASAVSSVPPLSPQRRVSATASSASRGGDTNILSPSVRSGVSGPRAPPGPKPRAASLTNASRSTVDIPTFSVTYRSNVLNSLGQNSNSNSSTHPPTSSIPGLYTQVQYHGPQSQPQPQPGPLPPIMWRQDLQGPAQNQIVVSHTQPQPQSQVSVQPLGVNAVTHPRFSSPPQPVASGTMPAPGQPGYAGFSHSRIPSVKPFENQAQMLVPSSAQTSIPENPRQQLIVPPPPPPPLPSPNQQQFPQGIRKGMPPRSSPPPGGIIPAPYNPSMPSLGGQSSPQQRSGSGMPPYSSPPPGGFAPAPYSVTSKQASNSTPPQQQGSHQTYLPTAGPNIPPQPNPPPGGYVPTAYTASQQVQAVPSGHPSLHQQPQQASQQLGAQLQSNPQQQLSSVPSGGYVPVQYHAPPAQPVQQPPQVLETVQQQHQQPGQQVTTPPQSSPRPEVYVPVSYTVSQTQTEPAKPPQGGYIPVLYDPSQAQPGLSQQQQFQVQQAGVQQNSQGQQQQVTPANLQGRPTSSVSQNSTEVPSNGPHAMSVPDQQSMNPVAPPGPNSAPGGYVPVSYYPPQTSAPPNAHSPSYSPQPPLVTPLSSSTHAAPPNPSVNGPLVPQPTGIPTQSQLIQAPAQTQSQVGQSGPTSYNVTTTLTTQVQSSPQPVAVNAQSQGSRISFAGAPRGSSIIPPRRLQKPRPQTHAHVTTHTQQHQNQYHHPQHHPYPPPPPHQQAPPMHGNYGPYVQPVQYAPTSASYGASLPPHPSNTTYTSPPQVQTLPTMSTSPPPPGGTTYTQPLPQQPLTSPMHNAYVPVNYGPTGANQNGQIQTPQQSMQYSPPQNTQVGVPQFQPPQQAMNQQYMPPQFTPNLTYGSYIPMNQGPAVASQNIPTSTQPSQQNPQGFTAQNAQTVAPQPLPSQQPMTQQQSPGQGNQGNPSQTQSNQHSSFTLSDVTNAINLGVSAINLFESVENAVNPGSYPGASSSNSGGGTNVTLNINAGGNQGSGQNSGGNNSGGSRLSDATNLVNSLSSAVTALSSLNIGGTNSSGNTNGNISAANLGSNNNPTNFGFNDLNSTGFNLDAFSNSEFNNAGNFGFGDNSNFGGGFYY